MAAREREWKLALASEADADSLRSVLPPPFEETIQNNTYWDLPGRPLSAAGVLVRLRLEERARGARAFVTVKDAAVRSAGGLFEAPEDEEEVPVAAAREVLAGARGLASLGTGVLARLARRQGALDRLEQWGAMKNLRRRYRLAGDLVVELDRTEFPDGGVEWEIELESAEVAAAARALSALLGRAGVVAQPQTLTKSERLARRLARG